MLDYLAYRNSKNGKKNGCKDDRTDDEKRADLIADSVVTVILLILWIFALKRAIEYGGSNKVLHILFACMAPGLYLIFSYTIKDFYL